MPRRAPVIFVLIIGFLCVETDLLADDEAVLRELQAFFSTESVEERAQIVRRIETDAACRPAVLSRYLHRVEFFNPLKPGTRSVPVSIQNGDHLRVILRIPEGYDSRTAYPLLYVLHGQGASGANIIRHVEQVFGDDIERYLVAAPNGYHQVVIHSTTPPSPEHLDALAAIRRKVHVDSHRVYVFGYSRGGHAAWMLAVTHPDEFAGVAAVSGSLLLHDYGELYETFLPNIAATRVFACWGENDVYQPDYRTPSPDGGIAGLNHRLCKLGAVLGAPLTWYEAPGRGHKDAAPPREDLDKLLSTAREPYPAMIRHVFRAPYQGRTAWIEAHAWRGRWWDQQPLKLRYQPDENPADPATQRAVRARAVRGLLGELRGEIKGQEIRVYRKKISELTVWIGEGMIDWSLPVALKVNGRKAFEGALTPDLHVCLAQAARTYDFDRLRWAGLRFKSGSRTKVVTAETPFPATPITPE